ncbi:hypothetical protein M408DRAFT_254167 [Serendipita vermifera MAFF 305830]|uniref:BZIP domain-containing protein n=1 Tax=Serendipita vermifera MAFF 305830 TaxID=933852 RepID=A0A0C3B2V5_SERVB|nr:hypothetical protein M408DRAFT_254167 [Serendipita vermifera MAFF 305830]
MENMVMDRSASPATSRDTAEHTTPPPNNALSPDNNLGGSPDSASKGRSLSSTKRAEQNRRAQRAFRERRDTRIKFLETRAELLNETLAQAEEAHRRWEECRALVDQLRHENAMLRAALDNAGVSSDTIPSVDVHSTTHSENGMELPLLNGRTTNDGEVHSTLHDAMADGTASPSKKRKRKDMAEPVTGSTAA